MQNKLGDLGHGDAHCGQVILVTLLNIYLPQNQTETAASMSVNICTDEINQLHNDVHQT